MTTLWVDTDFGFDDLWALLLLRGHGVQLGGISLVAGNAPLPQVTANALGARQAYGFSAPLWAGADRPLQRAPETAARILGPRGMQSRGRHLPVAKGDTVPTGAVQALAHWLMSGDGDCTRELLALGPLTNIARLVQIAPEAAQRLTRLVWMGGSNGPGNHTPAAEFNALADPEAALVVVEAGLPLDVVDLTLCRQVVFGPDDVPATDPLSADLLGGYLDIGLSRGRSGMAIYDPTAALALVKPDLFDFDHQHMTVSTEADDSYGETRFTPDPASRIRLAIRARPGAAQLCLDVFKQDLTHGHWR